MRLTLPLLLVSLCAVPRLAAAQAAQQTQGERPFKELVKAALEEFQLGHYAESLALFRRAHEVEPSARTFRGMGLSAFEAGQYVFAVECLHAAVADKRKPLTKAMRKDTAKLIERGETFIASLQLSMAPADARVSLNGDAREHESGATMRLDPGVYELVVSADGYATEQRRIELTPGAQQTLELELHAPVAAAADSTPVASVAEDEPRDDASEHPPMLVKVATIGGLSLALVGATVGTITGLSVLSDADDLEAACPSGVCPPDRGSQLSDSKDTATVSTVSFVVAGVGLAAGVVGLVMWATTGQEPGEQTGGVQPWLRGTDGGVRVRF